jgi:ferredoxin
VKTLITYFSGTGNSLAVSKDLARELNVSGNVAKVLPIAKFCDGNLIGIDADTDAIGVVFPVYCHDVPDIVAIFVNRLEVPDKYFFSIATYNLDPGNALFNLDSLLKKKGAHLSSGFHIAMPGNAVLAIDLTTTDDENQRRFVEEKRKIKTIAEAVRSKKAIGIEGNYNPSDTYDAKKYLDNIYKVTEKFWVTEECNRCEICVTVCPKKNIEMTSDKIVWHRNCEYCLACLHWCPKAAIQNGDISQSCRRYHHPEVSLKEMVAQR